MEKKIKKMYNQDCAIIFLFMIGLWTILIYVLMQINSVVANQSVRTLIFFIGIIAGTFAIAALMAVVNHLRKNRTQIYTEEITVSENNHDLSI
ncbi:hypothetical protein SH2C18_41770 [Clostridium sediminicola]|uniref:hypothetical protein n=1 Tax=Clostridium sediminicola TaxID=3114879 RepID=UPI0031F22DC5